MEPDPKELSPRKQALMASLLAERREGGAAHRSRSALPVVEARPEERHDPFPLSDLQQAYLVGRGQALELGNVANHGYEELECVGLDCGRLQRAWRRLIDRHEMLRAIVLPDGSQRILPAVPPYEIPVLDLRRLAPGEATSRLARVRRRMSHQVRHADAWPVFEVRVTLLDGQRSRLHVSMDGLLVDSWSYQIVLCELARLYRDPETSLPALELSFRDYLLTELSLRQGTVYRRAEAYWRQRLAALPAAPPLPLAKDPATVARPRFRRRSATLEPALWQRLQEAARRAGVPPAEVLLTAYSEVLAAASSSPRFTLNLPLSNRLPLHPQVNDVVGVFLSFNLLEVDLSRREPFTDRVRRLHRRLWQDLDHRSFTGIQVVRELARQRGGLSRAAMPIVFSSNLDLGRWQADEGAPLAELGETVFHITQTPQVWLDHLVCEEGGCLAFDWDAVEELFPAGLLDATFDAYCRLLRRLASDEEAWRRPLPPLLPAGQLARWRQEDVSQGMADAVLGELEAALRGHPSVAAAELSLEEGAGGVPRLAASVTPAAVADGAGERFAADRFAELEQDGALLDPAARAAFKLSRPGLRHGESGPVVDLLASDLAGESTAYFQRRSYRRFLARPVPLADLAELLGCLLQIELPGSPLPKYRYPSGGGLYPVQTYLYVKPDRVQGLDAGTYYYDPREHRLVTLLEGTPIGRGRYLPVNRPVFDGAAFALFLVAQMQAIEPVYGQWSRDFSLLEAGYMSQLLMETAAGSEIGLCPVGSLDFEPLREAFALEPSHLLLHSLLGGPIEASQATAAAFADELRAAPPPGEPAGNGHQRLAADLEALLRNRLPASWRQAEIVVRPAGAGRQAGSNGSATAPRDDTERLLVTLWCKALGRDEVGVEANFFDLGAHSLHLVQVLRELEQALGRSLPLTELFRHSTIASLAAALGRQGTAQRSFGDSRQRGEHRKALRQRRRRPRGRGPGREPS